MAPSKDPRLSSCVASGTSEIQGHRQVCRARRGGPRTPPRTTDANFDCTFVAKRTFLHQSLIVKSQQNIIELVTRPGIIVDIHFSTEERTGPQLSTLVRSIFHFFTVFKIQQKLVVIFVIFFRFCQSLVVYGFTLS